MIKENQRFFNGVLVFLDCLSLIASLLLAWWFRFHSGLIPVEDHYLGLREYVIPVAILLPLYIILYNAFHLYKPQRFKNYMEELSNIIKSNAIGIFILTTALFIFKYIHYSRYLLLLFAILSTTIVITERMLLRLTLRHLRKKGFNLKHIMIIGFSETAIRFIEKVKKNPHWGYHIVCLLADRQIDIQKDFEIIASISDLENCLEQQEIDEVFITLSGEEHEKLQYIINTTEKFGVKSQIIPNFYQCIPAKPFIEDIDGLPIIYTRFIPLDNTINRIIKRLTDLFLSCFFIALFLPLMLLIALIVKLTSPGPVIYKQKRVGYNRKRFTMLKFRSMNVLPDEEKNHWTIKDDPRKTKFGTFIRKTSLDELPQLFNVLKGQMSLVGPRPERPFFVDQFREKIPKYMIKHQVKPGMTGWAQVNGFRGDTSIRKRIEHDIYYIENWHYLLDIKILLLTMTKFFWNKNAY